METTPYSRNMQAGAIDSEAMIEAVQRLRPSERIGGMDLKPKQEAALTAMASGCTITEAAEWAGVHRNTASRWFNHDAAFRAAFDDLAAQMRFEADVRLRNTAAEACRVVEKAVFGGNVHVALQVMRAMGSFDAAKPRPVSVQQATAGPDENEPPPAAVEATTEENQKPNKFQPANRISKVPWKTPMTACLAVLAGMLKLLAPIIACLRHRSVLPERTSFSRPASAQRPIPLGKRDLFRTCIMMHHFVRNWKNIAALRGRTALERITPLRA